MCLDLNVVVDGVIYQKQSRGGISRLFNEIIPRMCDMDDSLHVQLLTEGRLKQALPQHAHVECRPIVPVARYLRPRRLWRAVAPRARQLAIRLRIGRGVGQIWHSTHYTLPEQWEGRQVVTVVDMIRELFPRLFNTVWDEQMRERKRKSILAANAVICISETTREDVQRFYRLDRDCIHVIPLAYSKIFRQNHSESELRRPTQQPFLLYVGARAQHKNFDLLTQAYSVWSHRSDVKLVVVGDPWLSHEERHVVELGIQDSVLLLSGVGDAELCRLYNRANAFIHPSLYEGFGIPLLEASACGCPVVASRIPSTVEIMGECPIYFESTQVDSLLTALDTALSEGVHSERVKVGLEQVKGYSWDETARQTLAVYRALPSISRAIATGSD